MMKKAPFVRKNRDNTENMSNYAQIRSTMKWTSFFVCNFKGFLEMSFCVKISYPNGKIVKIWRVTLGKRILSVQIFRSFNKFYVNI